MKLLAVETATALQSVGLLDGQTTVAFLSGEARGSHARRLIPMIDEVLHEAGWRLQSLDGLAVSIGPGSFTGLRVGLATMLGFRAVHGIPLATVPTLEGLCWNVYMAKDPVCPVIAARPGEVYWGRYHWTDKGRLEALMAEQVGSPDEVAASIEGAVIAVGDGWQKHGDRIRQQVENRGGSTIEAPRDKMQVSAVSIGLAGLTLLQEGKVAGPVVEPRYVQRAEAELVWERRTGHL
jgi:tRNA threonylcarbamoyladenosine biosynthesis protein TsaB